MSQRINFTKKSLLELSNPTSSRKYYYDQKVNGLGISITPKGSKSFFVYRRVNGIPKRITIGKHPDLVVEQARKKALQLISQIAQGEDPLEEKKAKRLAKCTLQEALNDYIDTHSNLKPGTVDDYRKSIRLTFPDWKDKPLALITEDMVLKRHKEQGVTSKAQANKSMRVLRAIFNFSIARYKKPNGKSFFGENPVKVLSYSRAWFKIERKKSYIKCNELPNWYQEVVSLSENNSQSKAVIIRDYLLFILLTGTRRNEAAKLRWSDVCLETKTFTLRDTKNSEEITLPMSDYVFQMLSRNISVAKSEYVFPGGVATKPLVWPDRQIRQVVEKSGIQFSIHDLRRTYITIGESLDISHYTLKRLVNHKSIESQDVTAGYVVPNMGRLRKATQQITDYILDVVEFDETSRIVSLEKANIANS